MDISFSHSQLLTSHHATRKAKQSKPNPAIIKTFMFKSGKKRSQATITDVDGRMCTKSTTTEGKASSLVPKKNKKKTQQNIYSMHDSAICTLGSVCPMEIVRCAQILSVESTEETEALIKISVCKECDYLLNPN